LSQLRKKALSGVLWTSLQQFSSQIVGFVVSVVLARLLLPEEFGLIAMLGVFTAVGWALMNSGLGTSLIRTDNPTEEDYATVFFFNLIVSVFLYLLMVVSAPYIADFYNQPRLISIVRWHSINLIISAFGMVQMTRLTKLMDFKTQLKISIPSTIISGVVGVSMAFTGYGVWSLVSMGIVQNITSSIQLWWYSKWRPSFVFSKVAFYHHFSFGYKLTLSGILDGVFVHVYTIIIGKFFAPALVGYYNRAEKLKQLPVSNISVVLSKVTLPLFAELKNDEVRLKSAYKKIMQLVIFLIAPILFIMAALAEPLFRFLFTEKWLPAVPYFQIIALNGILYPIHAYNLQILNIKGRSDLFLKLEIAKKILISVVLVIAFQFGIYGLLVGSVIISILALLINTHYTGKFLKYSAFSQAKDLIPAIFMAFLVGASVYFIDFFLKDKISWDIIRLLIGSLLGGGLYLFLAYIFKMNSLTELKNIVLRK